MENRILRGCFFEEIGYNGKRKNQEETWYEICIGSHRQ